MRKCVKALATDMFKNSEIRETGVVFAVSIYTFFHKKHAGLLPKIEQVLQEMKAEGLFEQYEKKAMELVE